ncbi:MAG: MgtC/SapB family protein [Chitinophagaceae bacterium]|nr:MgtC/SapB family protein [Chitinophagaceae bacterium]
MMDHWEIFDVYKALLAVAAGIILGLEREMKDKVAGLKTITIICLGAALFGILSYRIGGENNPTQIAAYVVSGVGFIGAGAIFKDGFSISGLTTAGIIWLAAAVGLSIGFGEFYLAATFMAGTLIIIFITPFINKIFRSKKVTRQLHLVIARENIEIKTDIFSALHNEGVIAEEKKITLKDDKLEILLEIVLSEDKIKWLLDYLLSIKSIYSFSF